MPGIPMVRINIKFSITFTIKPDIELSIMIVFFLRALAYFVMIIPMQKNGICSNPYSNIFVTVVVSVILNNPPYKIQPTMSGDSNEMKIVSTIEINIVMITKNDNSCLASDRWLPAKY